MDWLNNATTSNRLRQTYVSGFMDVSGGNVIVRNGDLLAYGNVILGGPTSIVNVFGTASFEQAPIMNGANIIPGSIPPYAIGGSVDVSGGGGGFIDIGSNQSISGNKTFNGDVSMNRNIGIGNGSGSTVRMDASNIFIGTASGQTISVRGNTTFTSAPFMSGANIAATSIPQGSIVGGGIIVDISSVQTISGVKTFVGDVSMIGNVILGNTIRSVNIGGNTSMARAVTVLGDLSMTNATGLLSLNGNVSMINANRIFTVAGNSNLNGNATIGRDLQVNGNSRVDGSFNATGNVILGDSNLDRIIINGISTFGNSVLMNRNLTVEGITSVVNLTASGNIVSPCMVGDGSSISFLGNTNFGVNSATNVFQGTITANGNVYLYGPDIQIGDASTDVLNIYSTTTARADVSVLGNVMIYGNTDVGDTVSDLLTVNARSVINGNVRLNQDVSLCRNVVLGDNSANVVLVKGNTTFQTAPYMSGANITTQTVPQSSIVGGTSGFVDLSTNQIIGGIKVFTNDMSMAGNVIVRGWATFDRPPVMSGASMELNSIPKLAIVDGANGFMDLSTNQVANGWKTFQGDVSLCGSVLLGDSSLDVITVMGETTFDRAPFMSGANIEFGTIPATAIVGGVGADGSFVDLSANQLVGGKKTFIDDISMNKNVYLSDTSYVVLIKGKTQIYNDLSTNANVYLSDTSYVVVIKGKTTMLDDVSMNGSVWLGDASNDLITITGKSTFNGDVSFNGNISLGDASNDTIYFVGKPLFDGDMSFNGNVQCGDASNDTLLVIGKSTFNSDMTINGNLSLNGGLQIGRVKQVLGGDTSGTYSGFYRLGKTSYPAVSKTDSSNILSNWNMGILGIGITDTLGIPIWSPTYKLFVAGSLSQSSIWTSTDGITWIQRSITDTDVNARWSTIASNKNGLYAFSRAGTPRVAISTDGSNWTVSGSSNFITGASDLHNYSDAIFVEDLSKIIVTASNTGGALNGRICIYDFSGDLWSIKEYDPTTNDNALFGVEWAAEINTLCAVGNGVISVSTNGGTSWASAFVDSNYLFNSVCWCSDLGLFVACGRRTVGGINYACILVSPNGTSWTQTYINSVGSTPFSSCCWSDEMKVICVVGAGFLAYSYDGIRWIYSTHTYNNATSVIWAKEPGLFLMTGTYWSGGSIPGQFAITNLNARPPTALNMFQHTYNRIDQSGNWYFQKMGVSGRGVIQDGFDFDVSGNGVIHGNTVLGDASNFALRVGAKAQFLTDVSFETGNVYIGGTNVGIGNSLPDSSLATVQTYRRIFQNLGTDSSYSQYNGYYGLAKDAMPTYKLKEFLTVIGGTWTSRLTFSLTTMTTGSYAWNEDFRNLTFVGGTSVTYASATDAITYTSPGTAGNPMSCVAYSRRTGRTVALGTSGTLRAFYRTVENYTQGSISSLYAWRSVVAADELGIYVAVSSSTTSSGAVATSVDGDTWTTYTPFSSATPLLSIAWSPELKLLCAVGYATSGSTNKSIAISRNGVNWTKISIDTSLNAICWSSKMGRFVAVGENSVYWSTDGVNWNIASLTTALKTIIWSDHYSVFVAANGVDNKVHYSSTGIVWNSFTTSLPASAVLSISWIGELGIFILNTATDIYTSDLRYRHTSPEAIFNHEYNNIDQNGNWCFKGLAVNKTSVNAGYNADINGNLNVTGNVNISIQTTTGTLAVAKTTVTSGYVVDVTGAIQATSYNATSDYRLKTNIMPLDTQINTILSLEPKSFVWKKDGRQDSGFIAQDIFRKYPHLRIGEHDGDEPVDACGNPIYLAFDYSKLTPYLWKGMQELILKVNRQEEELTRQKEEITQLKRRLDWI